MLALEVSRHEGRPPISHLKKLRRRAQALSLAVQIAEDEQRLRELYQEKADTYGFVLRKERTNMGGKPSKGTAADKRLKENKPKAPAKKPFPGAAKPFTKDGK